MILQGCVERSRRAYFGEGAPEWAHYLKVSADHPKRSFDCLELITD